MGRRRDPVGEPGVATRQAPSRGARAPANGTAGAALGLDPVIHERLRLGIVSALATCPTMRFGELKAALGCTDGNLSVHARRLELAGYVAVTKSFEGRVPRTDFRLTAGGRAALARYIVEMERLVRAVRRG